MILYRKEPALCTQLLQAQRFTKWRQRQQWGSPKGKKILRADSDPSNANHGDRNYGQEGSQTKENLKISRIPRTGPYLAKDFFLLYLFLFHLKTYLGKIIIKLEPQCSIFVFLFVRIYLILMCVCHSVISIHSQLILLLSF